MILLFKKRIFLQVLHKAKLAQNLTSVLFCALFLCAFSFTQAFAIDSKLDAILTEEEREFLQNAPTFRVLYDADWAPFESYDPQNDTIVGVNYNVLEFIADLTGLQFDYIPTSHYLQSMEGLNDSSIDMLLSYDSSAEELVHYNAIISDTYLSMPIAIIGDSLQISRDSILGVSAQRPLIVKNIQAAFSGNEVVVFPDMDDVYIALEKGEIDFAFENLYTVREALLTGEHGYFFIVSVLTMKDDLSFVFRDSISPQLVSIFDKALKFVNPAMIDEMLFYTNSEVSSNIKFSLYFAQNTKTLTTIFVGVLIALILSLLLGLYIQVKMKNKLWRLAYFDELTGLPNLSYFKEKAKEILENRGNQKYAILKYDIVKFNTINGVYGMSVGDKILTNIAQYGLTELDSETELCARVGIDTFIVLIRIEDDADSEKRAYNFVDTINKNSEFQIRFHFGRYLIQKNESDVDIIYEKVGFAHHYARQNENIPVIFDYDGTAREIELRHREIDSIMEDALKNEDYIVYLQGKYSIHTGELVGAEALVRWQYADGTPVSLPSEFIPLFEKNGYITTLDYYIFEYCCKILRRWMDEGKRMITISVNFSRLHLQDPNFIKTLVNTAEKYNIPKHLLEVELTESAMFDNIETLVTVLAELHEAGFTLSMDDFGAGYSSLGLLKDLPVDVIKLDRSFFVGNRDKDRSKVVLASIFSMAKDLNIKTLAEGVEYEDQVILLRGLGCEVVQGFFFAKPIKYDEFSFEDKTLNF